ncbi:MAG: GAF domain-containing protein [Anaerolineae bacterium]|nr:GAF domain-containing protein [Anaerolineae bacterium]
MLPDIDPRGGNILVVDDSATSRTWAKVVLERSGYHVRVAEDGGEALVMIESQPPDLILLDVILPGLDGYVVTRRLREDPRFAPIPIILLTTLGDVSSKVKGLEAGANDFLTKPPEESELLARVRTLLRLTYSHKALLAEKSKTELLYRISRELSAELDVDALLSRILNFTMDALDALTSSVILLDEQGKPIRQISRRRDGIAMISGEVWEKIVQEGLTGWVIRNQEGALVGDTRDDPRWIVVEESHTNMLSVLAVPMLHGGRTAGTVVLTHDQAHYFTREHFELLNSVASQSAIVIEKARAYQKEQIRARQLQLINNVGRQATSILHPNQLLREISRLICQSFDYYHVSVGLLEDNELVFGDWGYRRDQEVQGLPERLSLQSQGIVPWVVENRRPLLVPDVAEDRRYRQVEELPDTVAELAVPMQIGGQALGVLDVQSDRFNQLREEDIPLLETLASQIAIALRNAQLFTEAQRRLREQEALLETSTSVSSTIQLEEVLQRVAQAMTKALNVAACAISFWNQEDNTVALLAEYSSDQPKRTTGQKDAIDKPYPVQDYPATAKVLSSRKPLVVRLEHENATAREQALMEKYDVASLLMLPLRARDRVIGLVELYEAQEGRDYSEQEIAFCLAVADHAALAIENARLYAETEAERGKMAAVLGGTTDAVLVTDNAGRIVLLNTAAERAFGLPAEQAVGKPLEEVIPSPPLVDLFRRGAEDRPPHVAEVPLDDERILYASIARVEGVGHVAVMQDITYLKELEQLKNEFVATVSHDLRSPLGSIYGYADLLSKIIEQQEEQELVKQIKSQGEDFVQRIKVRARQMAELVEDLLDLGKIEAGVEMAQTSCQITTIVAEVVEEARIKSQVKKVALDATVPDDLPAVVGDPRQLRRAIDNLVGNAIKYTPTGGAVHVQAWAESNSVMVEVKDTGIGIPREEMPRLFEKFYRVPAPETEDIPGTGLGLAITKAIVEQHGGQVWVESEPGKGSAFGFSLPIGGQAAP